MISKLEILLAEQRGADPVELTVLELRQRMAVCDAESERLRLLAREGTQRETAWYNQRADEWHHRALVFHRAVEATTAMRRYLARRRAGT